MRRGAPTRVGQIAVPVRDVDRATTFYRDVLGLDHLFSAPPGLSFFQCGEVRVMLAAPEEGGGEGDDGGAGDAPGGGPLLYYAVDDLTAGHEGLVAAGADVVAAPHVVHRTDTTELRMGFYRDSEGNTFALMVETAVNAGEP